MPLRVCADCIVRIRSINLITNMFRTTGGGNIMNQMPRIKIMGIGHGGSNALHGVIDTSISNVGYVAVADDKMLIKSGAESTLEISRGVISSLYQVRVLDSGQEGIGDGDRQKSDRCGCFVSYCQYGWC